MPRILHTSDWQLGMTRHFLGDEAQAAFTQARFDAIRRIGQIAAAERCELVVVAGDVFESNQVDRRTVARALEALASVPVPIYLLPGNHDCLDAGSVYRSPTFTQRKPPHVHVVQDARPVEVKPGLEVVGAPWRSKRPLADLVAALGAQLEPAAGAVRMGIAHGMVDRLGPDRDDPALIALRGVEELLAQRKIHYLALGDRHSLTRVDEGGRIWYSGSPEPTDYDEEAPGQVIVADVEADRVTATPHRTGTWRFERRRFDVSGAAELEVLERWLADFPDKERTVVKLGLAGSLTLRGAARLESIIAQAKDLFAAIEDPERHRDIAVLPDDDDFSGLDVSGFARAALDALRARAAAGGAEAEAARGALALLVRLARGAS
jgi:DNA repair exonuclease SbcCD nuclease subunit